MNRKDPFRPEELDLPASKEFAELAGLLALAAPAQTPPAPLKGKVMSALYDPAQPPFTGRRRWAAAGAAAFAASLLLLFLGRPKAVLLGVSGEAAVDGLAAASGAVLREGSVVSVEGASEAVVLLKGRAAVRLSRGGRIRLDSLGASPKVTQLSGWALSAVKSGTPYSLMTPEGAAVSALGTDFLTKLSGGSLYVCLCRGRVGLKGFDFDRLAAQGHRAARQRGYQGASEGLSGHADSDIASLRAEAGLPAR